jgi:hypothetical protein
VSSLDQYRDVDEPTETVATDGPQLFYGSADDFVRLRLIYMYARKVGSGHAPYRWAADWWNYPEALARIDAMWRAWEHLRLDGATGSSRWWIEHADHHMPILLSVDGPFARSKDTNEPGDPLPYTPPPVGLFPDMRET